MIIGFAGKKQVGKSTAAGFLCDAGFVRSSFARTLKSMAKVMLLDLGFSEDEIQYFEEHKEEVIPLLSCTMRHLQQTLGTEWGRQLIHPDVWSMTAARCTNGLLNQGVNVVFEDIRFENEAAFIRERGGLIVHIERETRYSDRHESEAGIRFQPGDVMIYNSNLTIDAFRTVVLAVAGVESVAESEC
jgi:hypothetical protein